MAGYYTVKAGEHLSSIAKDFGFSNVNTIWEDPNNAGIRLKRENPNVLLAGDSLYIPDRQERAETKPGGGHSFVVHRPTLKLRLVLEDSFEKPIAFAQCDLMLGADTFHVKSDANGQIEQDIRPDTRAGTLLIKVAKTASYGEAIPIKIGDLDPVDEVSGQAARLDNLGYFPGDGTAGSADQFSSAVEEFQCDNNLPVNGICDPATQSKLKEQHGC
jgi:hypothetical protein